MKFVTTPQLFVIVLLLSACAPASTAQPTQNPVAPTTAVSNSTEAADGAARQAIAQIQSLAGLPSSTLEFVEMTTMINSPDGNLIVALYQDSEGRKFSVEPTTDDVVEIDARARLASLSPEASRLSPRQLKAQAEALVAATTPDFTQRRAELTYQEGVKDDLYFFDWHEWVNASPTEPNPPFVQVGLHASGELIAYYNTLLIK